MKLFIFFVCAIPFYGWSQVSYLPATKVLKKGGYELFLGGDGFKTSQVVEQGGTRHDLQEGESFFRYQAEVGGYIGATDNFQLGLGVRYRYNRSTQFIQALNETETDSSSGVQSTFLNLKYAFKPVGLLHYALEGMFRYTPYKNDEASTIRDAQLILGDDGNEYSAGLGLTYAALNNNYLTARVGFRRPGVELSPEIYWQAEGAIAWRRFALVAGVDGVSSLSQDPYNGAIADKPLLNTGVTNLYNSINREWITPYGGFNIAIGDHWRIEARGSQVVGGYSTDLGTGVSLYIIRRVDNEKKRVKDSKFKSYDIEASINKLSPKKGYVMIDRGLSHDVRKGMKFDFFEFDYLGGNILVASGVVIQAKSETSIVKISQRYNSKREIKEGLVGRASLK